MAFVEAALKAGANRTQIEQALTDAGWSRDQVRDGLRHYAEVDFVVPVPRPRPEVSARDAFLYLLMFGALYVSAYQLGSLLFDVITLAFPNELEPYESYARNNARDGIRWSTSALIVAFPVFLFIASRISKETAAEPARRNSAIRKWLTYLTLLVASGVIVGDLIVLVFNLLGGELTVRFVLKVLVVGVIAGTAFAYYLWSLKADDEALAR